jgi:undecaprenyl-diphosphatase
MLEPEVDAAARFLATHAILLLAAGVLLAVASLVAVWLAVRALARFQAPFRQLFGVFLAGARRVERIDRLIARGGALVPTAYVTLHLAVGLMVTAALAAFVVLAEDVVTGGRIAAFDQVFARELRAATTPAWAGVFAVITIFGSGPALTAAAGAIGTVLIVRGQKVAGVWFMTAQAGGALLNYVLKQTFERTRPEFADPVLAASSWSFPSGHAMATFIFCGLGAYLIVRASRSWLAAGLAIAATLAWCVLISFSRLYLGVHFASDVIAGMCAGAAWVAVCVSGLEVVRRRRPRHR